MTDPVQSSDHVLAHYLGASLQTATLRLSGVLIAATLIVALAILIL
ncbi:MAG: hypothetical protein QOJ54_2394 [Aliidongia sp.]|jgi:hypothetical protein|nr:hypothetical protein [Aliidongia sp.]